MKPFRIVPRNARKKSQRDIKRGKKKSDKVLDELEKEFLNERIDIEYACRQMLERLKVSNKNGLVLYAKFLGEVSARIVSTTGLSNSVPVIKCIITDTQSEIALASQRVQGMVVISRAKDIYSELLSLLNSQTLSEIRNATKKEINSREHLQEAIKELNNDLKEVQVLLDFHPKTVGMQIDPYVINMLIELNKFRMKKVLGESATEVYFENMKKAKAIFRKMQAPSSH